MNLKFWTWFRKEEIKLDKVERGKCDYCKLMIYEGIVTFKLADKILHEDCYNQLKLEAKQFG